MEIVNGVIGALALVVSAATFAFVLVGEKRFRRQMRPVVWSLSAWGKRERDGIVEQLVTLTNSGSGIAVLDTLLIVGARLARPDTERQITSWVFKPGDSVDIGFVSENVDEAWIVLSWSEHADRGLICWEWQPVMKRTPLADAWQERLEQVGRRRWLSRLRRWKLSKAKLGPGNLLWMRVPPKTWHRLETETFLGLVLAAKPVAILQDDLLGEFPPREPSHQH